MKSNIADNRQLFNAKAMATAGLTVDAIPDNTLGIIDVSTGLTVIPANFAAYPEKSRIVGKVGGSTYFSFAEIEKASIERKNKLPYVAPQTEVWTGTIENCKCTDSVKLSIHINDETLKNRDGLTWAHLDNYVEVKAAEMRCYCDCTGTAPVYENNVLTSLLVASVNNANSPFYGASAKVSVTGVTSGATLPVSPVAGDQYIKTGANAGLYVYTTVWVLVGAADGTLTDPMAYTAAYKAVNTDDATNNDGKLLSITIFAKAKTTPNYNDMEANYVYPRGTTLQPGLTIDGVVGIKFTKTTPVIFEKGAGYDLRAEEFDNMGYYTQVLHRNLLSGTFLDPKVKFQFENGVNYSSIAFDFSTKKVNSNDGDRRLFGVTIGTSVTSVYNQLVAMFSI